MNIRGFVPRLTTTLYLLASCGSAILAGLLMDSRPPFGLILGGVSLILVVCFLYTVRLESSDLSHSKLIELIMEHATHDMVFVTNAYGHVLFINTIARESLHLDKDSNKPIDKLIHLLDESGHHAGIKPHLHSHDTTSLTRQFVVDDQNHTVSVGIVAAKPYFLIVMHNITDQQSLEKERHEFISVASHELRTPLTVADGWLSVVLKNSAMSDKDRRLYLGRTASSLQRLKNIVNDLTTLSKAVQGVLDIEITDVDIPGVLTKIFREYQPQAEAKDLTMMLDIAPALRTVLTSEYRISEIVRFYVDNAIKFTKTGLVTLNAEPTENGGVLISVTDSGIGIPHSESKKLFATFYQKEGVETRETEGTGLGLYIVRHLAERLDARFWFTSKEGEGSVFYVEVPKYSHLSKDTQKVVDAAMSDI
jgi:signal transduction histidine kinase